MKTLLPAPLLSLVLWVLWLLLNHSSSLGHLTMGGLLAWVIPLLTRGLRPLPVRVRRPVCIVRLGVRVVFDALLSNLAVLRCLLLAHRYRPLSGFVSIPLQLSDPNALAALAVIVSLTPGTVWAEIALDRSQLMLHVLDMTDPQRIVDHVKLHYEGPLLEIFQ